MKIPVRIGVLAACVGQLLAAAPKPPARPPTICNPLDLPYRFELIAGKKGASFRTAADPSAIYFANQYWIFASKSGGYWHSPDFLHWSLVKPTGYNVELFAPTIEAASDRLYFATRNSGIYTTDDPVQGNWRLISKELKCPQDGALFADDDGRWYLYWGCSPSEPIRGFEIDTDNGFAPKGTPRDLLAGDPARRGWETFKTMSERVSVPYGVSKKPWIEGAWMTKVQGKYYLQYAAPGTMWDTYADGVFVSEHPLGPFTYEPYSPVSSKPTGFARGAGHGSTFKDAKGHYWHIATTAISRRHPFERRIGVYPVRFFPDGQMACNTWLGDYPQYPPGVVDDPFESNSPGWMLLSLRKPVKASSELPSYPAAQAVNEDLSNWWSAATGNPGEWFQVDLGSPCRIEAVQVNFADQDANHRGHLDDAYRYFIAVSDDGSQWQNLVDCRENTVDSPHLYVQLDAPVTGRFLRITNVFTPAGARFSLSGFRVFGIAPGVKPEIVSEVKAQRDAADSRYARIAWKPAHGAEFHIVRYGVKPDRLHSNCQVYSQVNNRGIVELDISLLNADVDYFFSVDAVNSSGISRGPGVAAAPAKSTGKNRSQTVGD